MFERALTLISNRRLHHKYFPGLDRYYTPFFSPTIHRALTPKEARELPAADSLDGSLKDVDDAAEKASDGFTTTQSVP